MAELSLYLSVVSLCALWSVLGVSRGEHACESEVYCYGNLLRRVQLADLYGDSKEFVDKPMKYDPEAVLANFSVLPENASREEIRLFVEENFLASGSGLEQWAPPDWKKEPAFLSKIANETIRKWAIEVNAIWKELGRAQKNDVMVHPQRYSLIPVPNPFIVPGGRFHEFYYWDTFWVVQGLLLSDMHDTARGMIENLASMVERNGFVPNGGRVYYQLRSQPPLLTQMADIFFQTTKNISFLIDILPTLDKEYDFWMNNRSVSGGPYKGLNYYHSQLTDPRPEAYREDVNTSTGVVDKELLFTNLASAAESGWDFSSRWFKNQSRFSSIETTNILPVDLNAILCRNEDTLAKLYKVIGNTSKAEKYLQAYDTRRMKFNSIFWDPSMNLWSDIKMDQQKHQQETYLSTLLPLAWRCGGANATMESKLLQTIQAKGFFDFIGGLPTSKVDSGQQWDFPNVWPPLQWLPVIGWYNSSSAQLRIVAEKIANKFISTVFNAWLKYNQTLYEKYDARDGSPGSGGEYVIQTGFGWTIAIVLHFLDLYPSITTIRETTSVNTEPFWVIGLVLGLLLVTIVTVILCGVWCRWIYTQGKVKYWRRVQNEHMMVAGSGGSSSGSGNTPLHSDSDIMLINYGVADQR